MLRDENWQRQQIIMIVQEAGEKGRVVTLGIRSKAVSMAAER